MIDVTVAEARTTALDYAKPQKVAIYNCCTSKDINGCWECGIAPCDKGMFSDEHDVRLRAFIKHIKEKGKDKLAERLFFNMQNGISYGHGKDYDGLSSIDAVFKKLEG